MLYSFLALYLVDYGVNNLVPVTRRRLLLLVLVFLFFRDTTHWDKVLMKSAPWRYPLTVFQLNQKGCEAFST